MSKKISYTDIGQNKRLKELGLVLKSNIYFGGLIAKDRRKYCPICKDDMVLPHGHLTGIIGI